MGCRLAGPWLSEGVNHCEATTLLKIFAEEFQHLCHYFTEKSSERSFTRNTAVATLLPAKDGVRSRQKDLVVAGDLFDEVQSYRAGKRGARRVCVMRHQATLTLGTKSIVAK